MPKIFIPGEVPSLKNSKVKTDKGIFHSKAVMRYLKGLNIQGYSSSKKWVKGYKDPKKPNIFAVFTRHGWGLFKEWLQILVVKKIVHRSRNRKHYVAFSFANTLPGLS